MKKSARLCVFLSVLFLVSCSPVTRSSGVVVDDSGKGLDNAKVQISGKSLQQQPLELSTKQDGQFDFGEIQVSGQLPTELKLTVTKDGYQTFIKDLKFGEDNKDKIVLVKLAK